MTTPTTSASGSVPKQVLAFYYGWYGNPATNKAWVGWTPEPGSTTQASNITDTPVDGLYSSSDPAEAAKQVAEAKSAGITGFIASWWGINNTTDKSFPVLLKAAENAGLKIAAMLEPHALKGTTADQLMASAEQDIEYLVSHYASSPAWLTVDGKPVVFIYGPTASQLTPAQWTTVLQAVNASTPNGIVAMGPNGAQWDPVFDGGFEYSFGPYLWNKTNAQVDTWTAQHYAAQMSEASSSGQAITTTTVMPGRDNSNIADNSNPAAEKLLVIPRNDGALYATQWQNAIDADPNWVLVTSWNEYYEGTEIEPTAEYGTSYLTETATYARQFLGATEATDTTAAASASQYAIAAAPTVDGADATPATGTTDTFVVTRSGDASGTATLGYAVAGSGASPAPAAGFTGGVYPSGQVSFTTGQTAAIISVPVAAQPSTPQTQYSVTLSGSPSTVIKQSDAVGLIGRDAAPPAGSVVLHGRHDQFTVRVLGDGTNGTVQDGSGASQALSGLTVLAFSDGVGVLDPTGHAEMAARLYQAALGRIPDLDGLKYWAGLLDTGAADPTSVAQGFAASPEFSQRVNGDASNSAFVGQVYHNVLDRDADASGMQFWTGQLDAGASRGSVLLSFVESFESIQKALDTSGDPAYGEVYRLYRAAMDRTPDAGGVSHWVSAMQQGMTPQQVAQSFVDSPEFSGRTAGLSNGDFVTSLYQHVLGHAGEPAGQQYWTAALDAGVSRTDVLLGFADSAEYRTGTAAATHDGWVFLGR